jgi:predicted DNA-binding antitoxin AbrB/MazE fold protein
MPTHQTFAGIYENGVVRPLTPLALPEATPVSIVVSTETPADAISAKASSDGLDAIYEILSRRHDTGIRDLAERHNEHQP